jgi:hypothetical protein
MKNEMNDVVHSFEIETFDAVDDVMKHLDGEIEQVRAMKNEVQLSNIQGTVESPRGKCINKVAGVIAVLGLLR